VSFGTRFARLATDVVVRRPTLWPIFRRLMEREFDRIAPQWDTMRSPESFAPFEAALAAVDGPVRDVLDLGTGTGAGAAAVLRRYPEAHVVGADLAEDMLARARANVPNAEFRRADASALPFVEESFDLVTHANMIPFFDELERVLRPGGTALFAFSIGDQTPIYVPSERLRAELAERGFTDFADFAAGRGTALTARKR
jgi:ubiquinone/menaquinone biosynthesis C-methylase UbiE